MTKHEARVALARHIAKDALKRFYDVYVYQLSNYYSIEYICSKYVRYWLAPFFNSGDIEDVKVKAMLDKDNCYPTLAVTVIAKNQAQYINVDYVFSMR